jgi:hypothetical protein
MPGPAGTSEGNDGRHRTATERSYYDTLDNITSRVHRVLRALHRRMEPVARRKMTGFSDEIWPVENEPPSRPSNPNPE